MNYVVRMIDIPKGSDPIVELQEDAIIVGPWQNFQADHVSIIYMVPVGLPPEETEEEKKEEETKKE